MTNACVEEGNIWNIKKMLENVLNIFFFTFTMFRCVLSHLDAKLDLWLPLLFSLIDGAALLLTFPSECFTCSMHTGPWPSYPGLRKLNLMPRHPGSACFLSECLVQSRSLKRHREIWEDATDEADKDMLCLIVRNLWKTSSDENQTFTLWEKKKCQIWMKMTEIQWKFLSVQRGRFTFQEI